MNGIILDYFAGGGGASAGIEAATGRAIDVAINHDPEAVAMHSANHPDTKHFCQDVWQVDPLEATDGQPVALAWFSPDCTHHSRARGGKPKEKKIRDLAWVVHRVIDRLKPFNRHPLVIMLENVDEIRTWGPLLDNGKPCPDRTGETFQEWVQGIRDRGYEVQWRKMKACAHSGKIHRAATSRERLFLIARRDGQSIIWPEPTHGAPGSGLPIWRTAADIIDFSDLGRSIFDRQRPLAEATCRRIAHGMMKFVVNAAQPFIVPVTNTGWGGDRAWSSKEPLRTITTAKGGEMALVCPIIDRQFGTARGADIATPLGTIMTKGAGGKSALVTAFLAQHNTMPRGGIHPGRSARDPLSVITTRGTQTNLVTASLLDPVEPRFPDNTSAILPFLIKYYGAHKHGQRIDTPLGAITSKARFGLVNVETEQGTRAISDIRMRMLHERELYRAQGFPETYNIRPIFNGKPLTKTSSIAKCGNSVPPNMSETLVLHNCPNLCQRERKVA